MTLTKPLIWQWNLETSHQGLLLVFDLGAPGGQSSSRTLLTKREPALVCVLNVGMTKCRWQALLSYLYTDRVAFAPLRSAVQSSNDGTNTTHLRHPFDPPLCSPKSMYRLADKAVMRHSAAKMAAEVNSLILDWKGDTFLRCKIRAWLSRSGTMGSGRR